MEIQPDRTKFDFSPFFLRPPRDLPVLSRHESLLVRLCKLWRCFLAGADAENDAERIVHALAQLAGKTALPRGPPFRDSTGGFR